MMACGLSKSLVLSSSLKMQQGIVTILGGGDSDILTAPSLKRTFSADLSSKNWLSLNGSSSPPMKRVSSSEKLRNFGTNSDDGKEEELRTGFDIWAQIQEDKNKKEEEEIKPGHSDVWSSILSEKKKTDTVPPPYVHPLMKRASSLSEKSLEICTESLGSETGCEGFSSFSSSETGDSEIEKEVVQQEETKVEEETEIEEKSITVPNHTSFNELPRGSFPPPIRSLSSQTGSSLHMKTRRDNGRLVLEAVSMPSHNNFSAKRQNGRLLLTFAPIINEPKHEIDMASDKEDETGSEVEEEEEEAKAEFAYKPNGLPITVHRLAHKPIGIPKRNSRWPATDELDTKPKLSTPVVHSLPPRPPVGHLARSTKPPSTVDDTVGAACFNTCNYFWKPTNTEAFSPNTKTQNIVNKGVGYESWINGCKERRRSLLSMEPFYIAT